MLSARNRDCAIREILLPIAKEEWSPYSLVGNRAAHGTHLTFLLSSDPTNGTESSGSDSSLALAKVYNKRGGVSRGNRENVIRNF